MKLDVSGKVAIVTGAGDGIGKACARSLLENGAAVVIAEINEQTGRRTADEFSKIGRCVYIPTDVTSLEQIDRLVSQTVTQFGQIDILVNNAGINVGGKRVDVNEFSLENWNKILAVDLTGVFYCTRQVSRRMIEQKHGGRIINIGSVFGNIPARKQIAFVAAKGGLHNMTKGLALELAPYGINVNLVAPGSILTEGTRALFYSNDAAQAEFRERMLSHVPLGKPGEVEDIANAVLFLSGQESKYITGLIMTVDGGWTCGYARDF